MSFFPFVLMLAVFLVLPVWAIVDVIRFDGAEPLVKTLWIFGILLFPLVGAIIWLAAGRRVLSSGSSARIPFK